MATEEELEQEESSEINPLDLSDEDIANMPFPDDAPQDDTEEAVDDTKDTDEDTEEDSEDTDLSNQEEDTEAEEEDDEESDDDPGVTDTEKLAGPMDSDDDDENSEEDTETAKTDEASDINYETEYKKLLAPFKANGKDIQVTSVDDAITLMKMGANYNKKMAGIKPNLKLMKMLENNDLLDESKLSYLIDLDKKNPTAINKLIKESGIDPLDIDTEKDTEYRPNTYTVDDKEVDLDVVLDEIRDTPTFKTTVDIISNKWDKSSKEALYAEPRLIEVINGHVASGIFDQITSVIESERMLGRLTGLSDIAAYKQIGEAIQASGGFNSNTPAAKEPVTPTKATKDSPKLKNRKRAASSTKSATTKKKRNDFNPLSISDEEFEKIGNSALM